MLTSKGGRFVILLLKFQQFGLSIKLKINLLKKLKIQERRWQVAFYILILR